MLFARKVWHLLVAIKDGLVLFFMLLFFMALYGMLTARPNVGQLKDGALLLKLDGSVVEEPEAPDPLEQLVSGAAPLKQYRTRDLVRAIELAASDDHIKVVVLDLSKFTGGGLVSMQELGAALDKVRAAKKPVLSYGIAYIDDGVLLAAHSSEVWLHPMGAALVMGPGGTMPYYGGLLRKYGVNVHVYKVGTFKDAVEPWIANGASAASKEARNALYGSLWETWKADVAKARPAAKLDLVTKDPAGWYKAAKGDGAQAALAAGLVDKIGDEVTFGERVKQLAGADSANKRPGSFAHSKPETLLAAHTPDSGGEEIAVVTVAGEIVDGKAGPGRAGGARIARLIDEASSNEAKALVLRVDSPGGSVLASEQIRGALERFKRGGRPVVVSMANMAASGGYWVSTPASRIFAEPGTVTGSIGIFAVIPSFEKTLAQLGVNSDGVRTTPLSGQPDVLAGFTPEAEAIVQAGIEHGYAQFIGLVAKSRGKSPEQVEAIAEGRVWDGGTARQNGLVDQFGGLPDALAYAASQAKLEKWHAEHYGVEDGSYGGLLELLLGGDEEDSTQGRDLVALIGQRQQDALTRALAGLARLGEVRGAQAYCLECEVAAPAPPRVSAPGWLGSLAAVLR